MAAPSSSGDGESPSVNQPNRIVGGSMDGSSTPIKDRLGPGRRP
jgi:hypothetical protein